MFLTNPFAGAFGLDIGDLALKLVQLKRRPTLHAGLKFVVDEVRMISLPPGYIVNGELVQPEMVRKKLLYLLGKEGRNPPIRVPWVVADVPEPKSFLKVLEIDIPLQEITLQDITFHAKKHLPFELDEYYLDWQAIGTSSRPTKTARVLIGAIPKIVADSYTYLLESAGLNPLALEIEALSLARALLSSTDAQTEGEARLILDLGATRSSFIIWDGASIQFTSSSTWSGELITNLLARELRLEYIAAENLKTKNGLAYDTKYPRYLKIATEQINVLVAEIKKVMEFYKDHFPNAHPVTKIILSGGASQLNHLDETLSRELKISTHTGDSWNHLRPSKKSWAHAAEGLELASAIGLALRAAENPLEE